MVKNKDCFETYSPPDATFSSYHAGYHNPAITTPSATDQECWAAAKITDPGDPSYDAANPFGVARTAWLQMDTGSIRTIVGVATQARGGDELQWVETFEVFVCSAVCMNWPGDWTPVLAPGDGLIFAGNFEEGDSVVRNDFAAPVSARFVRIVPVTYQVWMSMRAGVYIACNFFEQEGILRKRARLHLLFFSRDT